jgi:hypothetical protein
MGRRAPARRSSARNGLRARRAGKRSGDRASHKVIRNLLNASFARPRENLTSRVHKISGDVSEEEGSIGETNSNS